MLDRFRDSCPSYVMYNCFVFSLEYRLVGQDALGDGVRSFGS